MNSIIYTCSAVKGAIVVQLPQMSTDKLSILKPHESLRGIEKYAVLFPGQGVQTVGMGKELVEKSLVARQIFDIARDIVGKDLIDTMFNGPVDKLNDTANAQPAIFLVSYAAYMVFLEANPQFKNKLPTAILGHSLGQITALVIAGVIPFEAGLRISLERGKLMKREGDLNKGAMVAISGISIEQAINLCKETNTYFDETGIYVANDNTNGQVVLTGKDGHINHAIELAKAITNQRNVIKLPISIAAHSPLMKKARDDLANYIAFIPFCTPNSPIILNGTGELSTEPSEIKRDTINALISGVRFRESIMKANELSITHFIEVGGGPLKRFIEKAIQNVQAIQLVFN